jgi:hypothetical protein
VYIERKDAFEGYRRKLESYFVVNSNKTEQDIVDCVKHVLVQDIPTSSSEVVINVLFPQNYSSKLSESLCES